MKRSEIVEGMARARAEKAHVLPFHYLPEFEQKEELEEMAAVLTWLEQQGLVSVYREEVE